MDDIYIARQPIYDTKLKVVAYELLFRSGKTINEADFLDGDSATTNVIINAITEIGMDQLVGPHRAIINLTRNHILQMAEQPMAELKNRLVLEILEDIKKLENQGFQFEGAEASFELLMRRAMGELRNYFSVIGFRVIDTKRHEDEMPTSEATIQVKVGGRIEHTAAEGSGPVNALDHALRKALEQFYPELKEVKLFDYKVRVLPAGKGTASVTRVLIESGDKIGRWGTVGVSDNIIDASYHALVDAVQYKLMRDHAD